MVEKRATIKLVYNTRKIGYSDLMKRVREAVKGFGVTVWEYERNIRKEASGELSIVGAVEGCGNN